MIHFKPEPAVSGAFYVESKPTRVDRLGVTYPASTDDLLEGLLPEALGVDRFVLTDITQSAAGVMRGLYYTEDWQQDTLLRVVHGRASIAVVDLRADSPTLGGWALKCIDPAYAPAAMFIPNGCAYGSFTLQDRTVLMRQATSYDNPKAQRAMAWDSAGINWGIRPGQAVRLAAFEHGAPIRYDELMATLKAEAA